MAKIAANTITDLSLPRGQTPRIDPSATAVSDGGRIGAAMAAAARPYEQMAENAAAMGRRRVANIHARTREVQDAMGNFARGLSASIEGVDAALERRADEQADAEMARYSMHLLQNRDADYETPIRGDLAADVAHGDGVAPDGPYLAVSRRMAGWNDTESYKSLSDRARRKFEEKRRTFDQRTLASAMNEHVGRQRKMREAEEESVYASKAALAADAAIDIANPQHMDWHLLADDAINKAVEISLRRQHLLGDDGHALPGYEAVEETERRRITDAQYLGIWKAVADKYAASDDEGERNALLASLVTQVGGAADAKEAAKILDVEDAEAVADALRKAADGMPYSKEAAEAGWKIVKDAKKRLDTRLDAEYRKTCADAETAAYEAFLGDWDANDRLTELGGKLKPADRDALQKRMDKWSFDQAAADYEKRVYDMMKLTDPEARKAEADRIEAEVRSQDNPRLHAHVSRLLAGAEPRERKSTAEGRMTATTARLMAEDMMSRGISGAEVLDTLSAWCEAGEITRETWGACFKDVKEGTFKDLDTAEVVRAVEAAGFDLHSIIKIDGNGRPIMDAKGNMKLLDADGTSRVQVGWRVMDNSWKTSNYYADEPYPGGFPGRPIYVEVANETILELYEAAVKYKALEKMGGAPKGVSLGDFIKKECAGSLKALSDERLRASIRRQNAIMESDFRAMELHGRGATAPVMLRDDQE